jgi:hypothetical protein
MTPFERVKGKIELIRSVLIDYLMGDSDGYITASDLAMLCDLPQCGETLSLIIIVADTEGYTLTYESIGARSQVIIWDRVKGESVL